MSTISFSIGSPGGGGGGIGGGTACINIVWQLSKHQFRDFYIKSGVFKSTAFITL